MKNHHFNDSDRNPKPLISADTDSQPRILKTWLKQIAGRLVAHSPRLICTNCHEHFFAAEIKVKISHDGIREECPHCQADSFRIASEEAIVEQH